MWEKIIALGTMILIVLTSILVWQGFNRPTINWPILGAICFVVLGLGFAAILNFRTARIRSQPKPPTADAFHNPHWETVSNKEFLNETVELDGKRFYRSNFVNARFMYHGTAPYEFLECGIGSSVIVSTDNLACAQYARLERMASSLPGTPVTVSIDKYGNVKPDDGIKVKEIKSDTLQQRSFALCKEIRKFLNEIGPQPTSQEHGAVADLKHSGVVRDWKNRFESGYRQRFADRVLKIRNELQAHGLQDNEVDHYLFNSEFVPSTQMLRQVVEDLLIMAAHLED